ncbi:Carboxypeptidase activation peptide [Popillia japonica]|uniref:Carboxypeptidase activation peptide n=1 Tax=Popillia japonica TaxID=7064 RepID=A0AAW1JVJ4_POPJA
MKHLVLLSCLWVYIGSEYTSHDGLKTYEVYPQNQQQLEFLITLVQNRGYDVRSISQVPGAPSTIMVAPAAQAHFVRILNKSNISHSVLTENLENVLQVERSLQNQIEKSSEGIISFRQYQRYNAIIAYLVKLSEIYPDIVSLEPPGITYEGRKVQAIKIGTRVLYLIQELVEKSENRYMIEEVDWYIIPLLNPDGYEYSHEHERYWRKNRFPHKDIPGCVGVDLNRNFDLHWTSSARCNNDAYSGERPFDQKESQYLRDFVQRYSNNTKLYVTVHSFGNLILYPWGYTKQLPANAKELKELSVKVRDAIANKSGTGYLYGSISHFPGLGPVFGSSVDWVKGAAGVNLSYAIELPGRKYGFEVPPSEIINICNETFEAFKTFHNYVQKKFGKRNMYYTNIIS